MLKLGELGARLVVQLGVCFGFLMELHIQRHKLVYLLFLDLLAAAPFAVGNYELTELGSPVAEMVHTHAFIPRKFIQELERVTDNGRTEMSDMERLCDIRRGIVKHDRFSFADIRSAVFFALCQYIVYDRCGKLLVVKTEVEVSLNRLGGRNSDCVETVCKRIRYLCGRTTKRAAQLEAWQSNIAH